MVIAALRDSHAAPRSAGLLGIIAAARSGADRVSGSVDAIAADAVVAEALGDGDSPSRAMGVGAKSDGRVDTERSAPPKLARRSDRSRDADEDEFGRRRVYVRPTYAAGSTTPCDPAFSAYTAEYDAACEAWLRNLSNIVAVEPMISNLVFGRTIKFKAVYRDGIQAVLKVPQEMFPLEAYSEFVSYKFDRLLFQKVPTDPAEVRRIHDIVAGDASAFDRDTYKSEIVRPPPLDQSSVRNLADPLDPKDPPDPRTQPPLGNGYVPVIAWVDVPVAWLRTALRVTNAASLGADTDHIAWLQKHLFDYIKRKALQHPITVRQSDVSISLVAPPDPPLPPHNLQAWMKPSGGSRKSQAFAEVDDSGYAAAATAAGAARGSGPTGRRLHAAADDDLQTVDALGVSVQLWLTDVHTHSKSELNAVDRPKWYEYAEIGNPVYTKDADKVARPWFESSLAALSVQAFYDFILGNIDRNLHKNQHVIGGCVRGCGTELSDKDRTKHGMVPMPYPTSPDTNSAAGGPIGAGCVSDTAHRRVRSCAPYARQHEGWPAMVHLDQGWAFYLDVEPEGNPYTGESKVCWFSRSAVERLSALIEGTYGAEGGGQGTGLVDALWALTPAGPRARITRWHMNLLVDRGKKLLRKVDACVKAHGEDAVFRWA